MGMKSNLKKLRKDNNLSLTKLALKIGVNRHILTKIEDGTVQEFPIYALKALCKFFRVPVQELIIFDEEEEPELAYA